MTTERVTGGCLCGAVRIEARGAPHRVGLCHCLDCRKRHGTLFWAGAVFPADAVTVTGETRAWNADRFCPRCAEGAVYPERLLQAASRRGGSIFARWADEIEVHLGTLDEPSRFNPTYESWTVRREEWLPAFAGMRGFEGDREG